jgi:hypothetical protein
VEINKDRFTMYHLQEEAENFDYASRYLGVTAYPPHGAKPHIYFKVGDKTVATAVVSLDQEDPVVVGGSIDGSDPYDESAGAGARISLTVTVNGSPPDAVANELEEPRSIITAIYRELI